MKQTQEIEAERERLRQDYELITGSPFQYFYDPILLVDEDVELCFGHIVNQAIPNSCRKQVLQCKKVDGFFGSSCEEPFINVLKGKQLGSHGVFADKDLHKRLRPRVEIDGNQVEHYIFDHHKHRDHAGVRLENEDGTFVDFALKISRDFNFEQANVQIAIDYNALPEATASLIKAAHLTMFQLYGYKYVFHTTGYLFAKILQNFYNEAQNKSVQNSKSYAEQVKEKHFAHYTHITLPLEKYNTELLHGTAEDRRVLVCIGSSGRPFSFGVLIRYDDQMFIVFLPPDTADNMDSYNCFISNEKDFFMAKVFQFFEGDSDRDAHWETDPGPPFKLELAPHLKGD